MGSGSKALDVVANDVMVVSHHLGGRETVLTHTGQVLQAIPRLIPAEG